MFWWTNPKRMSKDDSMDTKNRRVWQVGAGDTDRNYGEICRKYDVMIVGPGTLGPYSEEAYADYGDIKYSIRRFYEAARGDVVLLRIGTGQVLAIGVLEDDQPQCLEVFGDVDGWTLQHTRRVRWLEKSDRSFPSATLGTRVRTFAGVHSEKVRSWLNGFKVPNGYADRALKNLPKAGKRLDKLELAQRLFIEGLASEYVGPALI